MFLQPQPSYAIYICSRTHWASRLGHARDDRVSVGCIQDTLSSCACAKVSCIKGYLVYNPNERCHAFKKQLLPVTPNTSEKHFYPTPCGGDLTVYNEL